MKLGYSKFGDYIIHIADASTFASDAKYYEVLLTKTEKLLSSDNQYYKYNFYVNLIEYLKLDHRNYPTHNTDTIEYETYLARKNIPIPLWKLSEFNLKSLLKDLEAA